MERELFIPIKEYFESLGYTCDGEVRDIDLYMEKGDERIAVELKVTFDFRALQQAALRQKLIDTVYIGCFRPKNMFEKAFKDKLYLLKRLGIGLIVVHPTTHEVRIINEPILRDISTFKYRNKKKSEAVAKEFHKRKTKNNIGGVTGEKIMTGYREDALLVLDALCELGGEAPTTAIRKLSNIEKSTQIMRANYYGWFENAGRGRYKVTDAGYDALEEFEEAMLALKKSTKAD